MLCPLSLTTSSCSRRSPSAGTSVLRASDRCPPGPARGAEQICFGISCFVCVGLQLVAGMTIYNCDTSVRRVRGNLRSRQRYRSVCGAIGFLGQFSRAGRDTVPQNWLRAWERSSSRTERANIALIDNVCEIPDRALDSWNVGVP